MDNNMPEGQQQSGTVVQQDAPANRKERQQEKKSSKDKEGVHKTVIRVIVAIVVIVVGIFLILFLVAKAAKYDTIGSMLEHMGGELQLMFERIAS